MLVPLVAAAVSESFRACASLWLGRHETLKVVAGPQQQCFLMLELLAPATRYGQMPLFWHEEGRTGCAKADRAACWLRLVMVEIEGPKRLERQAIRVRSIIECVCHSTPVVHRHHIHSEGEVPEKPPRHLETLSCCYRVRLISRLVYYDR